MMKDQVIVRFPDGSEKDVALTLSETDLYLGEFCIELAEVGTCTGLNTKCQLSAAGESYTLTFATEKKCARFVSTVLAAQEELETAPAVQKAEEEAPAEVAKEKPQKAKKTKNEPKGKQQPKGKKPLSTGAVIAIILAVVLVLAAVAVGIYLWQLNKVDPAYGENDVTAQEQYCAEEISKRELAANVVINAEGEPILTNGTLQIYHWTEYYTFMNYYGSYASMVGLNSSASLGAQTGPSGSGTWEQFFLDGAITNFGRYYALTRAAEAEGYVLPEEDAAIIADVLVPDGDFANNVVSYGFADVADYLDQNYGPFVTLEDYHSYMTTYITAAAYYEDVLYTQINGAVTDADVEAYFDANAESYGDIKYNNVSVRHILIAPEGDKDTETGDWTEEQWTAAETKANEVYALWQADPTVENFAALATEYTADTASAEAGGLYENFAPGSMVTEFNDWCFLQAHEAGDTGIVKTIYGYHIIYFVEQTETRAWFDTAKSALINERLNAKVDEIIAAYPIQADYAQMRLFDMVAYSLETE